MKRTLYVSDLDETLLGSNERLSDTSIEIINRLVERGMIFSYATARSYTTASEVTKGLSAHLPVIVYNGTFILDSKTQNRLHAAIFSQAETDRILSTLLRHGLSPIVRALTEQGERVTYLSDRITRGIRKYLDRRVGDKRLFHTQSTDDLRRENTFCFTCMDEKEKLLPAMKELEGEYRCLCFVDVYTNEQWLEIQPLNATKAQAILTLKRMLGCDRVICFGNGINDIPMFEIADECYAVANADASLKEIATAIIDSNDEDGVAKWLLEHFEN